MENRTSGTPGQLILADESFRIRGAVFEAYRVMGRGFLEGMYQECLALEFAARRIPFQAMPRVSLTYKGTILTQTYVPDFVCFDRVIVELKAVREIAPDHRAQVLNYLRSTGLELGLLVNFGGMSRATIERLVLQEGTADPRENTLTCPAS